MSVVDNNEALADWHMYFHGVDREDFPDYPDDHFGPKAGYAYQHDATNDEYHSILGAPEVANLLAQVKAGKKLDPQRLRHFTDEHLPSLSQLLQCDWLATKDDNAKEVMVFVAYRHNTDFENPAIATLIFEHLRGMGVSNADILSFIANTEDFDDEEQPEKP